MQDRQTIREKLGLSQDEMAGYLGITRSQVNMMERHARSCFNRCFAEEVLAGNRDDKACQTTFSKCFATNATA